MKQLAVMTPKSDNIINVDKEVQDNNINYDFEYISKLNEANSKINRPSTTSCKSIKPAKVTKRIKEIINSCKPNITLHSKVFPNP
jgi:hypothetical protein